MDPVGAIVVFVISWWLSFFCVLPIGVRGQFEDDGDVVDGTDEGAPKEPMLKKKSALGDVRSDRANCDRPLYRGAVASRQLTND